MQHVGNGAVAFVAVLGGTSMVPMLISPSLRSLRTISFCSCGVAIVLSCSFLFLLLIILYYFHFSLLIFLMILSLYSSHFLLSSSFSLFFPVENANPG